MLVYLYCCSKKDRALVFKYTKYNYHFYIYFKIATLNI